MTPKRQASNVRAAALACALALLAVGCASGGSASKDSAVSVSTSSGGGGLGNAGSSGGSSEKVFATAYLSVTENYFADATVVPPKGMAPVRYAITDQRTIARLAALINSLPTDPRQEITPCPSSLAPAYELDFQSAKDAQPVAEVSIQCFGVMVTARGKNEPILSESAPPGAASFLAGVASILSRPVSGS